MVTQSELDTGLVKTILYSDRMVLTRSVSSSDCATIVCRFRPPFSFFLNTMFGGDLFSLEIQFYWFFYLLTTTR